MNLRSRGMLKFISLNIEADKHFEHALPFLEREKPDVLALQEIFEEHLPLIEKTTGMTVAGFSPMALQPSFLDKSGPKNKVWGVALFSRLPILDTGEYTYVGDRARVPEFAKAIDEMKDPNSSNYVLRFARVLHEEATYTFATTHFTWTPLGLSTDYQREHIPLLFSALDTLKDDFVLSGDFNAPRGYGTWELISKRYTDNIPAEYKTSIDITLHHNGTTRPDDFFDKLVDGLFTTGKYHASNVKLISGVSDHMAICATIQKDRESQKIYEATLDTTHA